MIRTNAPRTPILRISGPMLRSTIGLLEMEYRPSEIAREIGVNVKTIYRSYIPAGLPVRRDASGNIWIVGTQFRTWAQVTQAKSRKPRVPIADDETYCTHCRGVRRFTDVHERTTLSGGRLRLRAKCAECGMNVFRITRGLQ